MRIWKFLTAKNMRMNFWVCSILLIAVFPLFGISEKNDKGSGTFLFVGEKENNVSVCKGESGEVISFRRGNEILREHFSSSGKLTLREWWEISPSVKRVKFQTFKYAPSLSSSCIFSSNDREEISYGADGRKREVKKYDEDFLKYKEFFVYAANGELLERTRENYFLNKEKESFREVFSYKENGEKEKDEFYENSLLRKRITYLRAGDFVEENFFPSFSTKTFFYDFKRQKVLFYKNGELLRTKIYEKF